MRVVSLGLMLAFLMTALHVVVDHGASGAGRGVLPHAPHPTSTMTTTPQTGSTSRMTGMSPPASRMPVITMPIPIATSWYTSAGAPDQKRPMPLVYATHVVVADNPVTPPSLLLSPLCPSCTACVSSPLVSGPPHLNVSHSP